MVTTLILAVLCICWIRCVYAGLSCQIERFTIDSSRRIASLHSLFNRFLRIIRTRSQWSYLPFRMCNHGVPLRYYSWFSGTVEAFSRKISPSTGRYGDHSRSKNLEELPVSSKEAVEQLQNFYMLCLQTKIYKSNVPWWYLTFNKMSSPFLIQRTKSKFVFVGPLRSVEILFYYTLCPTRRPEQGERYRLHHCRCRQFDQEVLYYVLCT